MTEETKRKPGQRGPGKKGAMTHVTIRVPQRVVDFYRQFEQPTAVMRDALQAYADYANK